MGLINTRAEINIIITKLVNTCNIPICPGPRLSLVSYNRNKRLFKGVCKGVEINISRVVLVQNIFVITKADYLLVLRQPWIKARRVLFEYIKGGLNTG